MESEGLKELYLLMLFRERLQTIRPFEGEDKIEHAWVVEEVGIKEVRRRAVALVLILE
jgi:hypothetical protein